MTFLDASTIIDMLEGVEGTVEFVESAGQPYLTSTICVYEVLQGELGSGETDVAAARAAFGGVRALELTDAIAVEAARLQDRLLDAGEPMAPRDVLVAATARSTGDHLVVADGDFATAALESHLAVTNLRA